jgi:uracil-DNA glycosylase
MNEEWLQKTFGSSWVEYLRKYLESEHFSKLGQGLAQLRTTKEIYPESKYVFRAFTETPLDKVKCVIYGQEPFYVPNFSDGLAFSNSLSQSPHPFLKNILIEIDDEYPEWMNNVEHGRLDRQDLSRWTKQGVMLLNVSLTVERGTPTSHIKYWEKLTTATVEALNSKDEIIHLFFGKESQKYAKFVTNKTHSILTCIHPGAETHARGAGFFGSNVFKEINKELKLREKKIIQW